MSDAPSEFDPVEKLVDSFLERYRRGERPSLSEYTRLHPELAEQIRELFPALIVVEELGSVGSRAGSPAELDTSSVPAQLGEYRILREVGRGGMGIVYEAVQESLGRHVALKVLPFHGALNPIYLERFRREARAAARLHHTNIVPVFGVGAHAGIHYYAMQFIHGQGLNDVLEEVKRLRCCKESASPAQNLAASVAESLLSGQFAEKSSAVAAPESPGLEQGAAVAPSQPNGETRTLPRTGSSQLSSQPESLYARQVAQIGVQVAEALDHAHREGVLHRDIKPSNLLLDKQGRVWVTDFGLAKTDETAEATDPGDLVGTLCYMAPERFQGRADARSDVYGLGITLYELVTLHAAFTDSQRARLIEKVTHEEPRRPRKLDARIPRDLETILLKAIAKDPSQRFATARAMADDLRRFLADRPIQARRTSLRERLWRWCRRNPVVAGLVAALFFALLGGVVGVSWEWRRAEENFRDAQQQRDEAQQHRARAEANARKAHQAFDEAFTQVSESKLIDVPGAQRLRHRLLQSALRYYQEFLAQSHDDPALRADLTAAHFRVATLLLALDQGERALAELRAGLDLADELLESHPADADLPLRLAGFVHSIRHVHYSLLLSSEPLREGQTLRRAIERWRSFACRYPDQAGFRSDLVLLHLLHGEMLRGVNKTEEALAAFQGARDLAEDLVRHAPAVELYQELLDKANSEMSDLLSALGRPKERESVHRAAVAFFEQQASAHATATRLQHCLASALNDLAGFHLRSTGQEAEADKPLRRAIALLELLVDQMPENADYRRELETSYVLLGTFLDRKERPGAEEAYRRSLALSEQLAANFPEVAGYRQSWAHTAMYLGTFLLGQGRLPEAEASLRRSVRLRERLAGEFPGHVKYAVGLWRSRRQLVWVLLARGRGREADILLQQSEKQFDELTARAPRTVAFACCCADLQRTRSHLLALTGRPQEAAAALGRCCSLVRRRPEILRDTEFNFDWEAEVGISIWPLVKSLNAAGRSADVAILHRQFTELHAEITTLRADKGRPPPR